MKKNITRANKILTEPIATPRKDVIDLLTKNSPSEIEQLKEITAINKTLNKTDWKQIIISPIIGAVVGSLLTLFIEHILLK